MKLFSALNQGIQKTLTLAANAMQIADPDDSGKVSFQISPQGDFRNTIITGGRKQSVIQRVDLDSMNQMIDTFNSAVTQIAHLMRGLPIYEGHIDAPDQLAKNGARSKAVGRIKKLYIKDGSLWADAVMNAEGVSLIKGDAAPYSANSPHWNMIETGVDKGGVKVMKPVAIVSTALVNSPNLPNNFIGLNMAEDSETTENNTMDISKLIKEFDLPEDSTLEDVIEYFKKLKNQVATQEGDSAALNAANTALAAANKELSELKAEQQKGKVEAALNAAISEGRITQEQKPAFEALLNVDFENGQTALNALPVNQGQPQTRTALNSTSAIGTGTKKPEASVKPGEQSKAVDLTPAFNSYMADNGLDKTDQAHVDQAWKAVRAEHTAANA